MSILTLRNISKRYGSLQALREVSFEVPRGSVFGILGPNGSGKTTLLGIVTDVLKADTGDFTLFDQLPSATQRRQIGTLLETPNFYHYLSGYKNLQINAAVKQRDEKDIDRVLEIAGLSARKHAAFKTYSLGMKQRLAIANTLLGDPDVLILDEPSNGLDPAGIAEVRGLIRQLAQSGKTIIMASHLLDEVEKVCTHVAVLQKGQLLVSGPVNTVMVREDFVEIGSNDMGKLEAVIRQHPLFGNLVNANSLLQVFFSGAVDPSELNSWLAGQGIWLNHLQVRRKSLESAFLEMTQN
ncbi:ABC transporter ATP-binding protein [Chitinophaga sancti]|uniref:ABC-2 type transport system ATP-binding protein n=1 Tax=Chitinophaga sancti TaxID=1004 RepID=A0A1K1PEZ3_9BACT|nr:ATP-binding cassette domain-containing protein [Chitinophaga sancti]WQD65826.1 ATP-binding cassette domain-containing protein [Chitinophaga sancti]WQG88552.1 ATP-binding cassette domain-containing protein [Chitinophaga sancti]SFW46057.1 ABC-2 type transport system ATP-binding protein [Chitinophaga sancti]